ncbi:flavin reductase family protein [Thalassotalea maritima]|uniref:flavin reductase family protein n=1 Tax=Thalassotalea maritima TaxID=3242416 RepID=UPI00352980D4
MKKYCNWLSQQFLHHASFGAYLEPVVQTIKPAWRAGFYRARVVGVDSLVANTVALSLQVDRSWPVHKAGQHIELTLEINGKLVTRVFTIASSPSLVETQRMVRLVIKQQSHGQLTSSLHDLVIGQWLNISAPMGDFVAEKLVDKSLLLAAGSGITPFIAMISSLKGATHQPQEMHLLYYAKPGEHLLVDELEALSGAIPGFSYALMTRTSHGDVTQQLAEYGAIPFYVCGPAPFYQGIAEYAHSQQNELYSEHFGLAQIDTTEKQQFDVSINGKTIALSNQSVVLTQLIEHGEPVTYGCKMGICHQCQCTKTRGVVKNVLTGQLSDRGEELIQLCVSQLMTDVELKV